MTPRRATAQPVDPRGTWQTIATPHFRVHARGALRALAVRAAAEAERAWTVLAAELQPPRGPVDLVVTDNADVSQGFATTFPTNRIVVFARPPVDEPALRFADDWVRLVVTHELAHLFHLDRTRGPWRVGQWVFGRHPALFPNQYGPSWLSEGLAVHVESRVTGAGRLVGAEHRAIAAAAARDGRVPRLHELSLGSSVFPGGQQAYVYGSLLVDRLAARPGALRGLIDAQSALWNPFRLDRAARRGVGTSFTATWQAWRDSLARAVADSVPDPRDPRDARWRERTGAGWFAAYPRWLGDSAIVYAANDARAVGGAYLVPRVGVAADGRGTRLGRRNSLSPNVRLRGGPYAGGLLFTQIDYDDPYTLRSDLYVQRDPTRGDPGFGAGARGERRLTRGARLLLPDARADGAIVAVALAPARTHLVRVSPDGRTITPLTASAADTQWTEPRWSPDGARVAAVRTEPGAVSSVVVLDTLGRLVQLVARERAVLAAPAWSADGRTLLWSSDRSGTAQLVARRLDDPTATVERVAADAWPLGQPAVAPSGAALAAIVQRGDGYHVVLRDGALAVDAADRAPSVYPAAPPATRPMPPLADSMARAYRPWRTLVPRWWTPIVGEADGGATLYGGASSATDAVGRHAWTAQLAANGATGALEGSAAWRWLRLGVPVVDAYVSQSWRNDSVLTRAAGSGSEALVTPLDRRVRTAGLVATLPRPRVRTNASLAFGAAMEWRDYRSPDAALASLAASRLGTALPLVSASAFWTNVRRPIRSISPEDGVTLSTTLEQRWGIGTARDAAGAGTAGGTARALGTARLYRALDLPGFAHHVLAVRLSGAAADARTASEWSAGGVSGSSAELVPGIVLGDASRPFAVRGFAPGAQRGVRAVGGSLEYRLPVALPARGLALLPLFLDRVSATAFADAASAWCPASVNRAAQPLCLRDGARTPTAPRWMASVGAEVALDASLQYDLLYRLRLGLAVPVAERAMAGARTSAYVTLGLPF